jgi:chemotaxis methyl-accepting protein methylase
MLGFLTLVAVLKILTSIYKNLGGKAQYFRLTIAKHEFDFIKRNRPFIKIILGKQQDLIKIFSSEKSFDVIINFHTLSYIPQKLQLDVMIQMINLLDKEGLLFLGVIDDMKWLPSLNNPVVDGDKLFGWRYRIEDSKTT